VSYERLSRRRIWSPSREQNLANCPPEILAAKDALTQFATRQLGLSLGPRRWDARVEAMDLYTPAGWQSGTLMAVLDLIQSPPTSLAVELDTPRQFTAWLMPERSGSQEFGRAVVWKAAHAILLPAEVAPLLSALDKLLAEGVIVKTPEGLRFTGKRPSFKTF